MLGLLGRKIGMTRVFDETGRHIPVTVVDVSGNTVLAQRSLEKNKYTALCLGYGGQQKNERRPSILNRFPDKKRPKVFREFRVSEEELGDWQVGSEVSAEKIFKDVSFLDVTGVSIGKGFQGVIRRYGMKGGPKTHGSTFHRGPGSVGQCAMPARVIKGRKMPGRMGGDTVTVQNLKLVSIQEKQGFVLVKGALPGKRRSLLVLKRSVKKPMPSAPVAQEKEASAK